MPRESALEVVNDSVDAVFQEAFAEVDKRPRRRPLVGGRSEAV